MSEQQFVMLDGSHHAAHPSCKPVGMVPATQYYEVSILLRRRGDAKPFPDPQALGALPPGERTYLSIEDIEKDYGADPADAEAIIAYLAPFGLTVQNTDLGKRSIIVEGLAVQFAAAFRTTLLIFTQEGSLHRSYVGGLQVPEDLADSIIAITGLDERPVSITRHQPARAGSDQIDQANADASRRMRSDINTQTANALTSINDDLAAHEDIKTLQKTHEALMQEMGASSSLAAMNAYSRKMAEPLKRANEAATAVIAEHGDTLAQSAQQTAKSHLLAAIEQTGIKTAPQIAELYDFPEDTDGSGQCIGIVELGGGYLKSDLDAYLAFLGLPDVDIRDVEVAGGANAPGVIEPYDAEVALDIQVIAGAAPGAKLVVYFAPLHARGFVEAVQAALYDKDARPSVLSISWDLSEGFWLGSPMHVRHLEDLFETAAALGVTILCSAGDYGSATTLHDGQLWVDYPASSPLAIGCGGTTLSSFGDATLDETVWNTFATFGQATGGGFSKLFPRPVWQSEETVPFTARAGGGDGRGVPDMAGNANPSTGYLLQVHGKTTVIGGTSAVAPLFAAMMARINESLGTAAGYINPLIYQAKDRQTAFEDVTIGSNGSYWASDGWDPVSGLGRPIGSALRDLLQDAKGNAQ
ncbi:S53 family peptidase [uncultured Tateyamaria sp.]|uniref:S53 family peptidase n=1 Tax=uncultured Tateyamaria sp. TaxID=455651 RepID=UPI00262923FB|nr:S53 family peptidase [uncultured Tateyamaria sp.]